MTPRERASLAEQLLANDLLPVILQEIESAAMERLIYAKTEISRIEAQALVLGAREFKSRIEASVASRRTVKHAPA